MAIKTYALSSEVFPRGGFKKSTFMMVANDRIDGVITDVKFSGEKGTDVEITSTKKLSTDDVAKLDAIVRFHGHESRRVCDCYAKVSDLPALGVDGEIGFASDGCKSGEKSGNGTGVPVYFSDGAWRVYSDDSEVRS